MSVSRAMLQSENAGTGEDGIDKDRGKGRGVGIPGKDGTRGIEGYLSTTRTGGGVSKCLDQRKAGAEEIPREGIDKSGVGVALGLPHL